jgi:hypothetical protein
MLPIKILYPLNFATSFYFLWTFHHAWARHCALLMWGCLICLTSSVFYYITDSVFLRKVDMVCCQLTIVYFISTARSFHLFYFLAMSCLVAICYMYRSNNNTEIRHSIIHFIANLGISFLIESCVATHCSMCRR